MHYQIEHLLRGIPAERELIRQEDLDAFVAMASQFEGGQDLYRLMDQVLGAAAILERTCPEASEQLYTMGSTLAARVALAYQPKNCDRGLSWSAATLAEQFNRRCRLD